MPTPLTPPAPPVVHPPATDKTPPLAAKGLTAVGQLAKDGTVGARLTWLLPGKQDVKSVRVGISQGPATPTSTQKASGPVVVVTRFGATLSRLQRGTTYTVAVYTVDAAANVSAAAKATLVGTTSKVTVTATSHAGLPVTVRGSLSDARGKPLATMPVDLLVRTIGSRTWRVYQHGTTNSSGSVSLTAKPMQNSEFTLRFAGGRGRLGLSSGRTATVLVHVVVVASVRAASGGIVAPKGGSARVTGQVLPGKRGKSVQLQKLVNRQWVTVATARVDGKGHFSFTLSTATTGVYAYLVRVPLDSTNLAGGSPELYLRVT